MDNMVIQYLTQAFAFVYVIDTSREGGVKTDRVGIEITLSFWIFFPQLSSLLQATVFFTSKTQEVTAVSYSSSW